MKYVIYGLGVSGLSALTFFAKNNFEVIATDDNLLSLENTQKELSKTLPHVKFLKSTDIAFDKDTTIIFAPGIPLYFPHPHKILEIVKNTQAKLICDLESFYQQNPKHNLLGITGTNGKSTVTALTGFIFKALHIPSEIGGNIGIACFDLIDLPNHDNKTYIFETSSYQLDLIDTIHFKTAALLNITPDHIDRHGSLQNYINSKKRIFKNQVQGDYALINIDNINSKSVLNDLRNTENFTSTIVPISTQNILSNGVSLIKGVLYNNIDKNHSQFTLGDIFLKGEHNAENIATAFALTYCYLKQEKILDHTHPKQIIQAIKEFKGLKHRMQFLGTVEGINFINDSKATNAESTENALKCYDNVFWILGGKAKEDGISILAPYVHRIKKAFLIGEASEAFATFLQEHEVAFEKCETLENAMKQSFSDAKTSQLPEKNILLSPACASFDQWKSFEHRGDFFCNAFIALQKKLNDKNTTL